LPRFRLSPQTPEALKIIDFSRFCHRSNSLAEIVFTISNPSESKLAIFGENFTNSLQRFLFAADLEKHIVASAKYVQSPVKPVRALLSSFSFCAWRHSP
jgi:hypothetical protein